MTPIVHACCHTLCNQNDALFDPTVLDEIDQRVTTSWRGDPPSILRYPVMPGESGIPSEALKVLTTSGLTKLPVVADPILHWQQSPLR